MTKITLAELKSIIRETIENELSTSSMIGENGHDVNWDEMRFLNAQGKLRGSWKIIMAAMEDTGGDKTKALQLLKASVAKMESKMPQEPEMASTEELTDFSKL